jgi:hypothetical protein
MGNRGRRVTISAYCFGLLLAWVLWTRTQTPSMDDWVATTGFASKEQCEANMKEKLDVWRSFKDAKFTKNSVTFTGNDSTMTFLCLPDTEDPRVKPSGKEIK